MDKQLLSEIKNSREVLEHALHGSGVSISQQDTDLRYIHFFNTHPGMAEGNLIGKTDYDWLPKEEADKITAIKRRALEGKAGVREVFKSTLNGANDGGVFYNDMRVEPVMDEGVPDKVVGIYTIAIDITEFRKALMRLEELNGRLLEYMEKQLDGKQDK